MLHCNWKLNWYLHPHFQHSHLANHLGMLRIHAEKTKTKLVKHEESMEKKENTKCRSKVKED
jgi:hypothetical protein